MTRLTIRDETDSLHEPAFSVGFVAIIAIELLAVYERDVVRKMPLMIEAENIGIARFCGIDLKLRVSIPKRRKDLGVSARRPRQFKDDALRRLRMPVERRPIELHPLLRGSFHGFAIVVAGRAIRARHQFHRTRPLMFLVAGRTGAILHHVWLVEGVMRVTGLAFLIDQVEGDAVSETFFHDRAKFLRREWATGHQGLVVTGGTVVTELCMFGGKFSGIKKSFAAARLKNPNRDQSAED